MGPVLLLIDERLARYFSRLPIAENRLAALILLLAAMVSMPAISAAEARTSKAAMESRMLAMQQMRASLVQTQNQDDQLIKEMSAVADRLQKHIRTVHNGSRSERFEEKLLPGDARSTQRLLVELNKAAGANPYGKEVAAGGSRIRLVLDPSLCADNIGGLREQPPEEWHCKPGEIVVRHNDFDVAVIWGGDSTGKPVFNRSTRHYNLICIRLSR